MKYIQIVNYKAWSANGGFSYDEIIVNDEIELEKPEYAKPEEWWKDYCDGNKNDTCDDALITVRLYAEPYDLDEEPTYTFEAWENELF